MYERSSAVIAVYLILQQRDGKIFFIRRVNTGYADGCWHLPSGHMEPGELPIFSVIREGAEETGVRINSVAVTLVHVSYRPEHDVTGNRMDLFFRTNIWSGTPHNAEPNKCSEVCWAHPVDLPTPMIPHVREAIIAIRQGLFFSELGIPFFTRNGLLQSVTAVRG